MKPEEQRIAIAKACGWRFVYEYTYNFDSPPEFTTISPEGRRFCGHYPDYLNSLDAMHEAEKVLLKMPEKRITYAHRLMNATRNSWAAFHATAPQRAEAFLRTLNLWKA